MKREAQPDRIVLQSLAFYAYHGVRAEEKSLGQRFMVDLALQLDLGPAGRSDDLRLTVDYSEVYRVVREILEGPSRETLEALAEETAAALLDRFRALESVLVQVKKPSPPLAGAQFGSVGVEISRARKRGEHE